MDLSLVISVMNEEENIAPLLEKIYLSLSGLDYEVIFVDDGSTDDTVHHIKKLANHRVKLIIFNKNYGQTTAMSAGINASCGRYVVTMDGDLQNDPADIDKMIRKLEHEDLDVVAGIRARRKDNLLVRKLPSKVANYIIRKTTGVYINDYGCSLKLFKSEVAKGLGLYGELHRFIPVLAQMHGARIGEMEVVHHPRIYGKTKYGLGRTFRVMSDLLLMVFFQKYLQRPMHLFGTVGIITFLAGGLIDIYLLILKMLGNDIWGRPILVLGVMLTLGGIQLITSGLLAEIIMRTYYESQNKKTYQIKESFTGKEKVSI
jgi:glycosyltransferase involved in cell wall biosynthesis